MTKFQDPAARLLSLAIVAFGAYVAFEGAGMNVGTLRRIGPGFFPILLGTAIALLGAATLFERPEPPRDEGFALRPLFCVSLAILAFGLLVRSAGLVPATLALVALVSLGQSRAAPGAALLTGLGLCLLGYLVFIQGLGLPLQPLVWPATGGGG